MSKCNMGTILKNSRIGVTDVFHMIVNPGNDADSFLPGQYINIRCSKGTSPLLRRPVSVLRSDPVTKTFEICYEVKGEGTSYLSDLRIGDTIDYLGPLGNSFIIKPEYKKIAVVGGGIGIFPPIHLYKTLSNECKAYAYFGFQNKDRILFDILNNIPDEYLFISTDDGSYGYKGYITDMFAHAVKELNFDAVFSCGPAVMMKTCASICSQYNIPCFVSLEERMACGIGACLGCACKIKHEDGSTGYGHVCKNGPIFNSKDVII